ncbi:MAG TPA: AMP-binding protein [Caulobacterales bacterium]|nr:AMP-binding protein [Caulobacterales bacterium]
MAEMLTIEKFLGGVIMARKEHLVTQVAARRARETPDRIYIQDVAGGELTFAQFHAECLTWADGYRRCGVKAGDRVMVMMNTSFDSLFAGLAPHWLKALDVNVNTALRGRWLVHILDNSQAEVLVMAERYLDQLALIAADARFLKTVIVPDAKGPLPDLPFTMLTRADFLRDAAPDYSLPGPDPWDDVSVAYTSGTTGVSKGVLQCAGGTPVGGLTYWPPDGVSPDDCYYIPYPTFHASGRGLAYAAMLGGARCVIRETFSTWHFWEDIRKYKCTITMMLGAVSNFVFQQPAKPDDADNPLRAVFMVPAVEKIEEFKRRFGVKVWAGFGGTDISSPIKSDWLDETNWSSCGRLRPGYQVRIVDEHDIEVPTGQVGEAIVRTDNPWIMNFRYFGMPEKTVEAWRNGWLHSGDGLRVDEKGNYYFVDRIKDAIRRRGENVSSFEVESEVNSHPAVLECAAIAVPSEWSEDEIKIVVRLHPDQKLEHAELIAYLIPRMPRYAIPRYVEFVEALPKTPTEKIQKNELRKAPMTPTTWDREAAGIKVPR